MDSAEKTDRYEKWRWLLMSKKKVVYRNLDFVNSAVWFCHSTLGFLNLESFGANELKKVA